MKTHIIVASINKLENVNSFASSCEDDTKIIIIDENEKYRKYNKKILNNLNYKFYGIKERNEWFQKRFGKMWKKYISVLPSVCRGRISFGFLVAYEENPKMVVEIDDDVFALNDKFLKLHYESLFMKKGIIVESNSKWYNTLENIVPSTKFFARGYPYDYWCKKYPIVPIKLQSYFSDKIVPIVVFPAHGKWIPEVCLDSYIEGSGYTNWIVDEYGGSGVKIKDSRGTE